MSEETTSGAESSGASESQPAQETQPPVDAIPTAKADPYPPRPIIEAEDTRELQEQLDEPGHSALIEPQDSGTALSSDDDD